MQLTITGAAHPPQPGYQRDGCGERAAVGGPGEPRWWDHRPEPRADTAPDILTTTHRVTSPVSPTGGTLERRVTTRFRRQERLTGSDPVYLSALISEAALARCARQPSVAAEQFRQLLNWAARPNIEILVLPFGAGLHSGMSGAFTLLSFPEGLLPDAGWQEYALGGHIIDDPADVASLTTLYEELRGQALGCDESLTLLAEFAEKTH